MSSIVKAKMLTDVLPKPMENGSSPLEAELREMERASIGEVNEKKETILRQALKKARHIENEAQLRADALMESAMKSSREVMNVAEKKGYDEGYLRGLVDGANASETAAEEGLHELRRLIELFKTEQRAALERNDKDLIEIAFELAKKIMKQHVQADENAVQKMLEEIILENEGSLKIYFSEYQKTLGVQIDKAIAKKMRNLTKDSKLVLIKGDDLIMTENEGGIVDMSVPVQLEQLKKAVDHAF
ncbi:MAG: FliH/SctL family protein [Eubacteriales bacterium]|nr:FliH/SctL family protein [Eubacteriales bacterium]